MPAPQRVISDPGASTVEVAGHRLRLTHLDRVLYPATSTTKADVVRYYVDAAPLLLPLLADRPVVRRRFPDGVLAEGFYERNAPDYAPEWLRIQQLPHGSGSVRYPMVDDEAGLVWLAGHSALELHVPQWTAGPGGERSAPDRLVIDLDPGEGAGLPECAEVALWVRAQLDGVGMPSVPVTSGSKGMQVYAAWPQDATVSTVALAEELAIRAEREMPKLVVARMTKQRRVGRVLMDWSQNNPAKTTICPYSLRAREVPWVACPRWWAEVDDPALAHVELDQMRERWADGDPMASIRDDGRRDHGRH